ncbi:MAG TPA: hypothetical protein VN428_21055, partial [Bryobacteraceae bacterium]|nr:hypothetical protein [Bryobacteraceae bacterium]
MERCNVFGGFLTLPGVRALTLGAVIVLAAAAQPATQHAKPAAITVDYPVDRSIFPPEFPAPLFLWRDAAVSATSWRIDVTFSDGSAPVSAQAAGERMRTGEIDPRAVAATNALPKVTRQQAAARTWRPEPATWAAIKRQSAGGLATVRITGNTASG